MTDPHPARLEMSIRVVCQAESSKLVGGENGNARPIPSGHYLQAQASPSDLSLGPQSQPSIPHVFLEPIHTAQELPHGKIIYMSQRARRGGEQISEEAI